MTRIDPPEAVMEPNRPSPEGEALGRELARLAAPVIAEFQAKNPQARTPCPTCAFTLGTLPNRCVATQMDALKCVIELEPFYCHHHMDGDKPTHLCAGWFAVASSLGRDAKPVKVPWNFSHIPEFEVVGEFLRED